MMLKRLVCKLIGHKHWDERIACPRCNESQLSTMVHESIRKAHSKNPEAARALLNRIV